MISRETQGTRQLAISSVTHARLKAHCVHRETMREAADRYIMEGIKRDEESEQSGGDKNSEKG